MFCLCFLLFSETVLFAQKYSLKITVNGIKQISGKIELSLYNNPETFPKDNEEYKSVSIPVKSNSVSCTINNLPAGKYALAYYHDANSDNRCNRNFIGIPKEGFGFSNNVKPGFRAPSFSSCKINLYKNKSIDLHILYY